MSDGPFGLSTKKPILKYYAYRASAWGGFHVPIVVLLYRSRGLSFAQIGLVTAISSAVMVLMEFPTGYLGDRIGRRASLVAGSSLFALGSVGMGLARTFVGFAVVQTVIATGLTFRSGTSDAWLYDYLKQQLDEDEFARVRGRGSTATLVVLSVTSLVGGYLGDIDYAYAYFATAGLVVVSIVVLLTFPHSRQFEDEEESDSLSVRTAVTVTKEQINSSSLRSFIFYTGLFVGLLTSISALFIQPISVEVGVSVDQLGWMYAAFTAVGAGASYFTGTVNDVLGVRTWFLLAPVGLSVLFLGVAALPVVAIPVFFVMKGVQRLSLPLAHQRINDNTPSATRATILSAVSIIFSLITIPLRLGAGYAANFVAETTVIGLLGALFIVSAGLLFAWQKPV